MRQETTEENLHGSLSMYEDLVSTIPVGAYRFRMKALGGWQFDFVNSRFCELIGLNREDVLNNYETVFSLIHPDDLSECISLIESVEQSPAPFEWIGRIIVDGQTLWMSLESSPTQTDTGDIVWTGYITDITDRKKAEETLRETEGRWKLALEGARDGVWDWNAQTNEVFFSNQWKAMLGYQEHEIGTTLDEWDKRLHPDDAERCYADLHRHFVGETSFYENEHRILCKDGSYKWILDRGKVIEQADDGKPLRVIGTHTDITERKRMEDELQANRKNFRTFFETIDDMIVVATPDGKIMYANPSVSQKLGYAPDELKTMHILDLNPKSQRQEAERIFSEMLKGERVTCPLPIARRDGTIIPTETRVWLGKWSGADSIFGICRDISKEQEALQKFNKLFELNPTPMAVSSLPDRKLREVNESWLATLGFSRDEVIGRHPTGELGLFVDPEKQQEFAKRLQNQGAVRDIELQIRKKDGGIVEGQFCGTVIDSQGEKFLLTVMLDVTDYKRAEEALKQSEKKFRELTELLPQGVFEANIKGKFTFVNPALIQIHGYSSDDSLLELGPLSMVIPEDRPRVAEDIQEIIKGKTIRFRGYMGLRKDGAPVPILVSASPAYEDEKVVGLRGVVADVTPLKQMEQDKEALQVQLFQSQKMEALGTLVGGIAHDFNNMLQIILGYSDLLSIDKGKSEPGYDELRAIIETAKGGADLVTKLLAFGQQAPIFPVNLELNHQISKLSSLISRTLPQVVQVDLDLFNGPTTIHADPNQIDQMLMNLAINSSEAMPDGGRLKISTGTESCNGEYCRNCNGVKRGGYVTLSVMDTGRGMDKETLSRIFEPFFSTKQRGSTRGTGLGLSVVKGIVQQHGGHVVCESAPGKGTEFRVYFSAIEEPLANAKSGPLTVKSGDTGTILVVEDSAPVAELEKRFLKNAGYNVIVATNGREALDIYRSKKEEISLVILDLLMPEMSGRDCLMEFVKIDPSVKALIASGYAPGDELHKEIRPLVRGFLQKPFTMTELLEKVRCGLDNYSS